MSLYSKGQLAEYNFHVADFLKEELTRHDGGDPKDFSLERLARAQIIGSCSDGARLYLDPADGNSLWDVWLDEGSVGKIAASFEEFYAQGTDIETG